MINRWVIVGLGNIGYQYDLQETIHTSDTLAIPRSHYAAIKNSGMQIVCGIDPDIYRREEFSIRTSVEAYSSLDQIQDLSTFDSMAIAVPTEKATQTLLEIDELRIHNLLNLVLEKPVGMNEAETVNILEVGKRVSKNVYINYTREFSFGRKRCADVVKGKLLSGNIKIGSDLRNNCSHFIRLLLGLSAPDGDFSNLKVSPILQNLYTLEMESGAQIQIKIGVSAPTKYFEAVLNFCDNRSLIIFDNDFFVVSNTQHLSNMKKEQIILQNDFYGGLSQLYNLVSSSKVYERSDYDIRAAIATSRIIDFLTYEEEK